MALRSTRCRAALAATCGWLPGSDGLFALILALLINRGVAVSSEARLRPGAKGIIRTRLGREGGYTPNQPSGGAGLKDWGT